MSKDFGFTRYQMGTLLYQARNDDCPADATLRRKCILSMGIIEDDSESWLSEYPEELRISRELAAAELEEMEGTEKKILTVRLFKEYEKLLEERQRIENELKTCERIYSDHTASILGRQPTSSDLQEIQKEYEAGLGKICANHIQ